MGQRSLHFKYENNNLRNISVDKYIFIFLLDTKHIYSGSTFSTFENLNEKDPKLVIQVLKNGKPYRILNYVI